jgi:GntR family transcriptional repressor for pyruvate dehydrogenase complex
VIPPDPRRPATKPTAKPKRQRNRLSERLADSLRQRIFSGAFPDDTLPRLDVLRDEYDTSLPPIREALRVLETEGLITIRRGNSGGAVIHRPNAQHVARSLALVLQSGGVPIQDVARAIEDLDPLCAQLCAHRRDRHQAVVPRLRENCAAARAALADSHQFAALCVQFHGLIGALCGNETLAILSGAADSIWRAHTEAWFNRRTASGHPAPSSTAQRALAVHEEITDHIEAGDARKAAALMRRHFDPKQFHDDPNALEAPIDADLMKDLFG